MQAKINYRYYALLPIHLMILAIIVVDALVEGLLWRVVGAIILGFGVYAFLAYWAGVVLFSRRRKPDDLPSEIAGDLARRGDAIIRPARPQDAPAGARLMYKTSPSIMGAIFGSPKRVAVTALRWVSHCPDTRRATHPRLSSRSERRLSAFLLDTRQTSTEPPCSPTGYSYPSGCWPSDPGRSPGCSWHAARMTEQSPPVRDGDYFIEYLAVSAERRGEGLAAG